MADAVVLPNPHSLAVVIDIKIYWPFRQTGKILDAVYLTSAKTNEENGSLNILPSGSIRSIFKRIFIETVRDPLREPN